MSDEEDDADLQMVAPLVMLGILKEEAINRCMREQTALKKAGRPMSLLTIMLKNGVLTKTQVFVWKGVSLEQVNPFPDYKILRHVGEGGMADVYEATYLPVKARVALKVLKTEYCLQEHYRLRFKREANVLLLLEHENIVEGREYKSHDGVDFYAMSFVDGVSLLDVLDKGGLTEGMAVHVAAQIAGALEHMRQKGIVHRDVKPGNLVMDGAGVVRIIDFGFAKVMKDMRQDTGAETTVGTVEYMPPEQAKGEANVDSRADVYSLGASLFHMATGELPFQGKTQEEVMYGHVKKQLEFSAKQRAKLSAPTMFILQKAMAKEPADRYQTPQEMKDDLEKLCAPLIAARGPVPAIVQEASVEEAPIPVPGAKPASRRPPYMRPGTSAGRPVSRGRLGRHRPR